MLFIFNDLLPTFGKLHNSPFVKERVFLCKKSDQGSDLELYLNLTLFCAASFKNAKQIKL